MVDGSMIKGPHRGHTPGRSLRESGSSRSSKVNASKKSDSSNIFVAFTLTLQQLFRMNLSPVRTALRHNSDHGCLPCLHRTCSTPRWQQSSRARIVIPTLSPSVATSLHNTIDRADRAQRLRSELRKKPPREKDEGSRRKSPSPRLPSPASTKEYPVLQKTHLDAVTAASKATAVRSAERPKKSRGDRPREPSSASANESRVLQKTHPDPVTAASKATAARNTRRWLKKSRGDRPEPRGARSPTKSPERKVVKSKDTASETRSSKLQLLGNKTSRLTISDAVSAARVQLSRSSKEISPRSHLETTADAGVEEQQHQAKEGGLVRFWTGTREIDNVSVEKLYLANPPSDSIPPKPLSLRKHLFNDPTHHLLVGSAIEKVQPESPPQSLTGGLLSKTVNSDSPIQSLTEGMPVKSLESPMKGTAAMQAKSDSPLRRSRTLRPKYHALRTQTVRRARSTSDVPRSVKKGDQGEAGQPMTLEERLKKDSKIRQVAFDSKAVRKVKSLAVRRINSTPKTENDPMESNVKPTIQHVNAVDLNLTAVKVDQPPVPTLAYGLDRVLFNPGVYHLQDPRSRVYNFDPYLQNIMPPSEFDYSALKEYITSSRDEALISIAEEQGKRYVGSSSSMTSVLARFHFLLSQWRKINTSMVSRGFPDKLESFTLLQRCPTAIFLRWKDGTYAIDADKEFDSANVLMMLGRSMEKLLTLKTESFERYRKSNPAEVPEEDKTTRDAFHYSTMGDFLMRSQLDAHDPRLPGTGMFDLKTRAVVSVRMNFADPTQGSGYEIQDRLGEWESYEREYFDMIRSAFLKYSLQVRMGRMDGIFVAFHNTERIFGFQYVSLEEMDLALHGQSDKTLGNEEFKLSIDLLNTVLNKATERFPNQSIRLHFETRETSTNFMYIFAEPVTEEQIEEIQSKTSAAIEEFQNELLGLVKDAEKDRSDEWDEIQAKVDEAMAKDERGVEEAGDREDLAPAAMVFDDDQHVAEEVAEYEQGEDDGNLHIFDDRHNGAAIDDAEEARNENISEEEEELEESEDSGLEETQEGERLLDEADDSEDITEVEAAVEVHETENAQDGEEDEADVDETLAEDPHLEISATEAPIVDVRLTDPSSDFQEPSDSSANSETPGDSAPTSADATNTDRPDFDSTADPAFLDGLATESTALESRPPILAMTLTIRNKVNDMYVLRPHHLTASKASKSSGWSVEYTLREVEDCNRAWALYEACQARRRRELAKPEEQENGRPYNERFMELMRSLAARGRRYRERVDKRDKGKEKVVLGWEGEGDKAESGAGSGDGRVEQE